MKPNFVYYVEVKRKYLNTSPFLLSLAPFQDTVDRHTALSGKDRHYVEVHILLDGLFSNCQFVFLLMDDQKSVQINFMVSNFTLNLGHSLVNPKADIK